MCEIMEKIRAEGVEEGREAGRAEGKREVAIRLAQKLIARGRLSFEEIAEDTGLTLEQIEELAKVQLV